MVISALIRASELQNAEIQEKFSRKRIEVNLVTSKRTSDKMTGIFLSNVGFVEKNVLSRLNKTSKLGNKSLVGQKQPF